MADREDSRKTSGPGHAPGRGRSTGTGGRPRRWGAVGSSPEGVDAGKSSPGEPRPGPARRRIAVPNTLPSGRAVLGGLLVALAALGTYVLATHHDGPPQT